jgi:hypothetical protein
MDLKSVVKFGGGGEYFTSNKRGLGVETNADENGVVES